MKTTTHTMIVILADMGKIRALRLHPPGSELFPHVKPGSVEEIILPCGKRDTDRPGRFPKGTPAGESCGMCPGEDHNEEMEFENRRIREIAGEITGILERENDHSWSLAAPDSINNRLVEHLPEHARESLATNIRADLTCATLAEIERRFHMPPLTSSTQ